MLIRPLYNVCVFGGTYPGLNSLYTTTAYCLGAALAQQKMGLIYGGAKVGVMGAVADGCLTGGGYVEGVIPEALQAYNITHPSLSELTIVENLDTRKARMVERADAFIILPGGFGTLDEAFSVITTAQLALHTKPVAVLNIDQYYDSLLTWIEHACQSQFIAARDRGLVQVYTAVEPLLGDLRNILSADRDTIRMREARENEIKQDALKLLRHTEKDTHS